MKKLLLLTAVLSTAVFIQSCSKQVDSPAKETLATQSTRTQNSVDLSHIDFKRFFQNYKGLLERGTSSTTEVYTNDMDGFLVDGSSTIHRNHVKATIGLTASDAPNLDVTGHACTLWALVWHSAEDAFGGAFPYAMYRIGGNVSDDNSVSINGVIKEGDDGDDYYNTNFSYVDPATGETVVVFDGSMPLDDAENDFFVPIVKSHGPMIPSEMPGQIHTFNGGCDGDLDGGGPLAPCWEYLFAMHF